MEDRTDLFNKIQKLLEKIDYHPEELYQLLSQLQRKPSLSREDVEKVSDALKERKRYGVDITPIIDLVIARGSVR